MAFLVRPFIFSMDAPGASAWFIPLASHPETRLLIAEKAPP